MERVFALIKRNPKISQVELSELIGLSRREYMAVEEIGSHRSHRPSQRRLLAGVGQGIVSGRRKNDSNNMLATRFW